MTINILINCLLGIAGMAIKSSGNCLQLPSDVWERVAQFMSLKEWARLGGTCKTICSVRLKNIQLETQENPPLQWLQRHWGNTESMCLVFDGPVGPWLLKSEAAPLASLTSFHLGRSQ